MGIISPGIGLRVAWIVDMIFGFAMVCAPKQFSDAYKVDSTSLSKEEQFLTMSVLQFGGINLIMLAALMRPVFEHGKEATKGMMAFFAGIAYLFCACVNVKFGYMWIDLGADPAGIKFNIALQIVVGLLCLAGASFSVGSAPLGKGLYWGSYLQITLYALWAFGMFFATDQLLAGYGLELEGLVREILVAQFKTVVAPFLVCVILLWLAYILSGDVGVQYGACRIIGVWSAAMFFGSAMGAAIWTAFNVDGKYDGFVKGQNFNMLIWFILLALFNAPIDKMNATVFPVVADQVVSAREVSGTDGSYVTLHPE